MNANSLQYLHIGATIPDTYVEKNRDLWETLTTCRQLKTLEIISLSLSSHEMEYFKEICGAGDGHVDGTQLFSNSAASLPQRSVILKLCPFDEWPDEAYDDESFTLPLVTSVDFSGQGPRNRVRMSGYGHGRMIRKCLNLKRLRWSNSDFRADVLRAKRWNYEDKNEVDWFFGGLLGDISGGPERQWKIVRTMKDDSGSVWWPYLDTIELGWKQIPDLTCARLLKRLNRLETLRWMNPTLGHLSMEELFRERAPLQSTHGDRSQDSAYLASILSPPRPPAHSATSLPRRLCTTLKNLDLLCCHHVPSEDIQRILELCPVLEEFRAEVVDMSNILERPEWVCRGIRFLSIQIVFLGLSSDTAASAMTTSRDSPSTTTAVIGTSPTVTTKELESAVFTRLAQLCRIKTFVNSSWNAPQDVRVLQMKLGHGLEMLEGWGGTIEHLYISHLKPPDMEMDDIRWMLDHWSTLKTIVCRQFSTVESTEKEIKETLTSRGIKSEYTGLF